MNLVPVSEGATHRFGGVGNVLVCVYRGAPEAAALRERIPWVESTLEKYPKIGLLVVVTEKAGGGLPDREFREESRRQAERFRGRIEFSASVIEGKGVQHTLVRTFLRGLSVVAGKDVAVRFFSEVVPAAEWAASLAGVHGGPTKTELMAAVGALRLF